MGNPYDKIRLAMDRKPAEEKKAPPPPTGTAGTVKAPSMERSKDPKIQAEIDKRMEAQRKADAERLRLGGKR